MSVRGITAIINRTFWGIILFFAIGNKVFAEDSYSPAVSMVTAVSNEHLMLNQTFARIDNFMSLPEKERVLLRYNNKYAYTGAGQQVFSPTFIPDENAGVWIKSFTLFEQIPLNNGPNVSNVGYGTLVGVDTDLKHYKNGWDAAYTVHGTFQGSRENFKTTSSVDTIGNGGVTGAFFKKKFYTAATAVVGGDYTHDAVGRGEQTYRLFITSVASKTGYNIEFKQGKYILQPSLLVDYIYVLGSDFISSDGKSVTGDPLNAMHVSPSIKLIGNFKGGWQPYLAVAEIWTLMDSPVLYKNGVLQDRVSVDPYFEYGGGLQRKWKDRYTSFGQILFRGGGRNGVSFYFGFRYAFGKDLKPSGKNKLKEAKDKPKDSIIQPDETKDFIAKPEGAKDFIVKPDETKAPASVPVYRPYPCYPCY